MQKMHYLILLLFLSTPEQIKPEYIYIKSLHDVTLADISLVGGKNASLGQMISSLSTQGIRVPHGFAVTVDGYAAYIDYNNLAPQITALINQINNVDDLSHGY